MEAWWLFMTQCWGPATGNRGNTNHHSRLGFKENVPKLIKADVLIPVYIRLLNHLLDFLISEDQADTETIYWIYIILTPQFYPF